MSTPVWVFLCATQYKTAACPMLTPIRWRRTSAIGLWFFFQRLGCLPDVEMMIG
jgi:hypothetical protein